MSNDELHIILKRRNLEICKHSMFFNYWTKNVTEVQIWFKRQFACSFLNSDALKLYEARRLKKLFSCQILYRSLDPPIKKASILIIYIEYNYIIYTAPGHFQMNTKKTRQIFSKAAEDYFIEFIFKRFFGEYKLFS